MKNRTKSEISCKKIITFHVQQSFVSRESHHILQKETTKHTKRQKSKKNPSS